MNRKKYRALITLKNGKRKNLGLFNSELQAVFARYLAVFEEWREFANPNNYLYGVEFYAS